MNDERILGQGHSCRELLPALRRHFPTSFLVMNWGKECEEELKSG